MTIHDLVTLEHPELHPPRSVAVQRAQLDAAIHRATFVLSVSHATADMLRSRGVEAARIIVAPLGVTTFPAPDCSIVPRDPYLLAVGALTPRKGLGTLLAAFARARLPGVRLVLAGPPYWNESSVLDAIGRHGVADRVTCTGRVSDARLAALYETCLAVCVPSVAEGFGLPVLEAAAAGAPVVASDLPVFRELEGPVALYVPVGDEDAWTHALERVVADDALRLEAGAHAGAVARRYTWDHAASLTITAYERAVRAA
jgi:glycosyltransferase involved in cell wall biosynthesis